MLAVAVVTTLKDQPARFCATLPTLVSSTYSPSPVSVPGTNLPPYENSVIWMLPAAAYAAGALTTASPAIVSAKVDISAGTDRRRDRGTVILEFGEVGIQRPRSCRGLAYLRQTIRYQRVNNRVRPGCCQG